MIESGPENDVLTFTRVDAPEAVAGAGPLIGADLRVRPGGLTLVRIPRGPAAATLGDVAVGMLRPTRGQVCFQGRDWLDVRGLEATVRRRAIGRVYEGAEWLSNLNVDENVLLRSCHATSRSEAQIVEEALALADRFGLSELSSKRPNLVGNRVLRAYALVRAFLGEPQLLVLERPLRDGTEYLRRPLTREIQRVRERGAGVLWITPEESVLESGDLEPDVRYGLESGVLRPLEGDRS